MAQDGRWRQGLRRLGKLEARLILPLPLAGAAFWIFAWLAEEMGEGETHAVDEAVMLALRTPGDLADPVGPHWLELTARDLTSLGGVPVLMVMTLVTVLYLLMNRKAGAALLVTMAVGGALGLNILLKDFFARPRPDLVPHGVEVLTNSFPSGHAMLSAAVYLTLGAMLARTQPNRRLKAFFLLLALGLTLLIGTSRVYLGVHWPSDVAAGWTAGAGWALACWGIARLLRRREPSLDDKPAPAEMRDEAPLPVSGAPQR
ncbi:MAG TPA: phosphatase PAP2 family protein [Azospirillaceae bacterium]|nr:phosphatase PAP2 family protein [Azospirillaceae bacterium]